ncbi:uncharacterized protein NFIA_036150 [Aspergillus fischeri NRRL 181]|uniref:DUF7136 domain-containing protein n=1 Tax=Neosartorya fischeri (strain ATCC 1020 / DSM 3700 / CBS 544.65 / FGSC A1164 / JCM 1740 / NRRL 181 / WB 181) TaxID=331117 RepID=A1CZ73_NEOFI|nr:conserved hypothetical protein [Aspergillus fischeri NRRL 181]EAW24043.1 conserved hypothetical protein [Aspergillus fischeri NRRL 181]
MGLITRGWLILALCLGFAYSQAPITPGVTEVDLIFPRNESYSPSPVTPIIFAIQNPSLLSSLNPEITYYIEQQNVNTNVSVSSSGSIRLSRINYTTSDPYYLYWSTGNLDIEGTFVGASSLDFVAATEDDACDKSQAQAVQVPDLLEVPPTRTWGAPSCAATVGPSPTPNPCKVKIDSTAAASISAALASSACANPVRTGLSCPTPPSKSAASWRNHPSEGPGY